MVSWLRYGGHDLKSAVRIQYHGFAAWISRSGCRDSGIWIAVPLPRFCGFVFEFSVGRGIDAVDPVEGQAIRARLCDFELLSLRDARQVRAVLADISLREYRHT